jgi:tyrosyl-tRNA synthetase
LHNCDVLLGDYWEVWPTAFHANLLSYENGSPRRIWPLSHRSEEIDALCRDGGAALNNAKSVLAFTLTEQVHGTEEAKRAQTAAEALFGGGGNLENMPTVELTQNQIEETGLRVTDLLVLGKLCLSKSDARRMIESGAVFVDEDKVTDVYFTLDPKSLEQGVLLRKGKKGFVRILRA